MAIISKVYRKVLTALLACLGFIGVAVGCDGYGGVVKPAYGAPPTTFKAKGVVVCETDGTPIQGIHVALEEKYQYSSEEQFRGIGSTYTGNNGVFNVEGASILGENVLYVKLTDVDGEENGLYAGKVIEAHFRNITSQGEGSGSWYRREVEIYLGTIKMELDNKTESE